MRVAIIGGPGSGKGTQAKLLSERYRVPQISTGDLLRDAIKNDKGLSNEAKEAMAAGKLVDDAEVLKLLDDRLRKKDTKRGFLIDGYPRNIPQAQSLDTLLGMLGKSLQIAINIDVDSDDLVKRIVGRQGCEKCGSIFNKYFSPPKVKNQCDKCGEVLSSRVDDTAKTAGVRIKVYNEETAPLITYYRAQHKLRTMSGMGNVEEIHEKLCGLVDLEIRPLEVKTIEMAAQTNGETDSTVIAGGQINRIELDEPPKKSKPKKKKASSTRSKATPAKKVTSKKGGKKASAKKALVRKATAKKAPSKKVPPKKPGAKKTAVKKAPAKKTASKNVAKKPAAKKTAAKKPTAKKTSTKKTHSKTTKKIAGKKTASKKKAAKKTK